jgi:hypothetical protein
MARRQGHDGGIVPVRSRNDGQRQDQIFYKARHGPDPGQGSQAPHIMGDDMTRSGNPPRGRFDAGNAAKMGRQTDAAGCVAADVQGRPTRRQDGIFPGGRRMNISSVHNLDLQIVGIITVSVGDLLWMRQGDKNSGRRSIAMMRIIIETNPLNNWADKIERRST